MSFQDSTPEINDFLTDTRTFALKEKVARLIKDNGWPMVMNVVIHRLNIDHIGRIIEMAADLGASYLELANSQYYSWAHVNRDQLLPSREQLQRAEAVTNEWRARLGDRMKIFFVVPDYYEGTAEEVHERLGQCLPDRDARWSGLPCHTARMLPGLAFPKVRETSLREVWYDSEGFNRYRGTAWMKDPCRDCGDRDKDLGGCRCQAFMLTGDPMRPDPVCARSPEHACIDAAIARAQADAAADAATGVPQSGRVAAPGAAVLS